MQRLVQSADDLLLRAQVRHSFVFLCRHCDEVCRGLDLVEELSRILQVLLAMARVLPVQQQFEARSVAATNLTRLLSRLDDKLATPLILPRTVVGLEELWPWCYKVCGNICRSSRLRPALSLSNVTAPVGTSRRLCTLSHPHANLFFCKVQTLQLQHRRNSNFSIFTTYT